MGVYTSSYIHKPSTILYNKNTQSQNNSVNIEKTVQELDSQSKFYLLIVIFIALVSFVLFYCYKKK